MRHKQRQTGAAFVWAYMIVAAGWIVVSAEALKSFEPKSGRSFRVSIHAGWGIVFAAGLLLWWLSRRLRDERARAREIRDQQLLLCADYGPGAMAVFDLEMKYLGVSQRWRQDFHLGDQPIIGRSHYEIFPDIPERWREIHRRCLQGAIERSEEDPFLRTDGTTEWLRWEARPWRDAEGAIGGILIFSEDITARKLAETALRDSEERYRQIFAVESDAILVVDRDTHRFIDVNPAAERMYGYTHEEFLKLLATDVSAEPAKTLDNIGSETAKLPRLLHRRKDGTVFPVEVTDSTCNYQGRRIKVGAMRDITERERAEEKIRKSEERYRQLFELESDALFLIDCETRAVLDTNQSAERLYGYSREEFLCMKAEDISAEPAKTKMTAGMGAGFVSLRWHRKKDGTMFPVEISASFIEGEGKGTELAAMRDITERQQALTRLQETAAQLLDAQKIASLGSYVLDVTTGRWTCSQVLDDLFGIVDADFPKDVEGWIGIVHRDDRAELRRYFSEEVLKRRTSFDRTYRIVRRSDLQERWVQGLGRLVVDDRGQVVKMVGVIQDITERKRAEEQTALQFSALSAAANAIVITDRRGKIEWVNPAFSTLTGYSADEVMGSNPRLLKSGEQAPGFYVKLWATVTNGRVWHGELVNKRKDGRFYTESMTITPVRGANGQIAHYVAIKQDVTERRQLESRLQQAQKMEAVGTLAGGIAHDFNNILSAIFGYGNLLQQDTQGNAGAQEEVAEILKAAERAKGLVQQILTFCRQREQQRQVIPLDTIIKEASKFLRASLPAQITIHLNLAADAPPVLADPTQIYQVTMNLATNALHAMEGGPGQLIISLEDCVPDAELLRAHPELQAAHYARFTVSDSGCGMDAKTMERIFEPFFTTKPVGRGTGLGLSVVHGIVQAHEAVITVESQPGHGTTFRLYFPAQRNGAVPDEGKAKRIPNGSGQSILLLDDEPALTTPFKKLLEKWKYQVTACNDPREAVRLFRENPSSFDLVITDLTMPVMSGLEVARELCAIRPDVSVILLSGYTPEVGLQNLQELGICHLLCKPVPLATLADAVQKVLGERSNASPVKELAGFEGLTNPA